MFFNLQLSAKIVEAQPSAILDDEENNSAHRNTRQLLKSEEDDLKNEFKKEEPLIQNSPETDTKSPTIPSPTPESPKSQNPENPELDEHQDSKKSWWHYFHLWSSDSEKPLDDKTKKEYETAIAKLNQTIENIKSRLKELEKNNTWGNRWNGMMLRMFKENLVQEVKWLQGRLNNEHSMLDRVRPNMSRVVNYLFSNYGDMTKSLDDQQKTN